MLICCGFVGLVAAHLQHLWFYSGRGSSSISRCLVFPLCRHIKKNTLTALQGLWESTLHDMNYRKFGYNKETLVSPVV